MQTRAASLAQSPLESKSVSFKEEQAMQQRFEAHRVRPRHLPETFYIGDEKVGVRWVAVATGHLNRTGAIPGG